MPLSNKCIKKLLVLALSVSGWGCGNADERLTQASSDLEIKIVNENNQAFKVQIVRWWYSNDPGKEYQLRCKTEQCAEWAIETEITAPIVIRADTSVVKEDDKTCWDLYTGKAIADKKTREVLVVMTYTNTACASEDMNK